MSSRSTSAIALAVGVGVSGCGRSVPPPPSAPIGNTAPTGAYDQCPNELPPRPPIIPGAPCEDFGCNTGYRIFLTPAGDRWPPGAYRFTVTADQRTSTCTSALPFQLCENEDEPVCIGDAVESIARGNCGAPDEGFFHIAVIDFPCRADVTIERDGREVAAATFWPVYAWLEPGGTGCEPQCLQGNSELPVQ